MDQKLVLTFTFLFVSLIGLGDFLLQVSGPSCTVTSLIPGTSVNYATSMEGTCYSILSCRGMAGVPIGKCPAANVCCVFPRSCEATSSQNQTYFTNPGYPSPYNGSSSCTLTIHRTPSLYKICQLRLNFINFELNRPIAGTCESDRFVVSGQNSNSVVPPLCGVNNGQHIYVDIEETQGPYTLRMITNGPGYRRWNIQVAQIECANPSKAPANCLQYHLGPSGSFSSFNYETSRVPETIQAPTGVPGAYDASYLNGLDYAICFRKESGFCTQTYQTNTSHTPFEILNFNPSNQPTFQQTYAGAGAVKCAYDYLLLNGIRYCGSRLNPGGLEAAPATDSPVTDMSAGPFIARFTSDFTNVGRGFRLSFQQNPCGSRFQTIPVNTG